MSSPTQTAKNPTVGILYGLSEGRHTGRYLRRALQVAGFRVIPDTKSADIIFTHSGGCFLIPKTPKATLIVLVGVPYWPGKALLGSTIEKQIATFRHSRREQSLARWFALLGWHVMYFFRIIHDFQMWRGQRSGRFWRIHHPRFILLRNERDAYCTPDLAVLPFREKPTIVQLPGGHDDCWSNPEPYVRIIKSYYES